MDPDQPDALGALACDLVQTLLNAGASRHRIAIGEPGLAARFNEFIEPPQEPPRLQSRGIDRSASGAGLRAGSARACLHEL